MVRMVRETHQVALILNPHHPALVMDKEIVLPLTVVVLDVSAPLDGLAHFVGRAKQMSTRLERRQATTLIS